MYAEINMEGRVVNDPEFKTGKNGEYCTFRLVVNQKLGPQENASFYNCTGNDMCVRLSLHLRGRRCWQMLRRRTPTW